MDKRRFNAGFTLVEVLLAVVILAMATLGFFGVYTRCFELTDYIDDLSIAINAAQERIEQIRSQPFPTLFLNFNGPFDILDTNGAIRSNFKGTCAIDNSDPDCLIVWVNICWNLRGRVYGEDRNLDGIFNAATEDANGNNQLDAPVQLVTRIAREQ